MNNKSWITKSDIKIFVIFVLCISLGSLLGLSLGAVVSKSLPVPFTLHTWSFIGAMFGLLVSLIFISKPKNKKNKFKKHSRNGFKFNHLLFYLFIGAMSGIGVILIAVGMSKGEGLNFAYLLFQIPSSIAVGIINSRRVFRNNKPTDDPDSGIEFSPVPKKPKPSDDDLAVMLLKRRKNENYSDIHRYLN
ncbi:MAG: hypothetical protein DCE90_14055 [Pseudanabaena sp.]|nr:MAG: hypothetical protein DCE90_14055 [Pseudanabaena sp.]